MDFKHIYFQITMAVAEAIVQRREFTALYFSDGTPTAARRTNPMVAA